MACLTLPYVHAQSAQGDTRLQDSLALLRHFRTQSSSLSGSNHRLCFCGEACLSIMSSCSWLGRQSCRCGRADPACNVCFKFCSCIPVMLGNRFGIDTMQTSTQTHQKDFGKVVLLAVLCLFNHLHMFHTWLLWWIHREACSYDLVQRGFCIVTGRNEDDQGSESNGAGKSALVMAPLWALTGKSDARNEASQTNCTC